MSSDIDEEGHACGYRGGPITRRGPLLALAIDGGGPLKLEELAGHRPFPSPCSSR